MFRPICKISKSDYYLCHICPSVCPLAWTNPALTKLIFVKFNISAFFEYLSRKSKYNYCLTRIFHMKTFHTYDNISLNSS
jgi:hypothetical protein